MKIKFYLIIFALSLMVSSVAECRISEVVIATESWVHATDKDGTGLYWELLEKIFEPEGIKIKKLFRTYMGSVRLLEAQKVDVAIGAYEDEIENAIYPENYFAVDIVKALARKGFVRKWEGEKSLKNKKTGWIEGYSYDDYLSVPIIKKELEDRKSAFRVLDGGRIDFYLDAAVDLTAYFRKNKDMKKKYDDWIIMKLKLFIVFAKNEKGRILADIFDRRFEELLKSGEIGKMYDYYINVKKADFTNPFINEKGN